MWSRFDVGERASGIVRVRQHAVHRSHSRHEVRRATETQSSSERDVGGGWVDHSESGKSSSASGELQSNCKTLHVHVAWISTRTIAPHTCFQVLIEDLDRKATCKSVNDPHVTTFDGFEFNNFLEGEFVLYEHKMLPFAVRIYRITCT